MDDAKGTREDPDAVRSRFVATQVNTCVREDVTQATPPIKAPASSSVKLQRKQMRRDTIV